MGQSWHDGLATTDSGEHEAPLKLAWTVSKPSGVIGSGAISDARRVERSRSPTRRVTPRESRCSPNSLPTFRDCADESRARL